MVRDMVSFRSEIYDLRLRNFEIAQRILQIAQIDKSCATHALSPALVGVCQYPFLTSHVEKYLSLSAWQKLLSFRH